MCPRCDSRASSYVAQDKDTQNYRANAIPAPVPAAARARRTTAAHTANSPIRLSTTIHTDVDVDVSPPRVSRKDRPAHRPPVSTGSTQRPGKNKRSSTVSHKTMEQVSCQQLCLFVSSAAFGAEVAVKREVTSMTSAGVAHSATRRSVIETTTAMAREAIADEIVALRGYLASRLDEKGLPRDDTALLDSCGVDTGRLLRMARRLAALEDEMRRLG